MRIIHTSDWHLGQHFFTKSRAAEHQAFLAWLLEQVKIHQVDAILVCGDIFDTASPPSYARELYNRFVVELQHVQCQLIILAGNHDSVATLNESRDLFQCLNTSVIASATPQQPENQLLLLKQHNGKPGAILCAVPYLRPRDMTGSRAGETEQSKKQQLHQAIKQHYATLYARAQEIKQQLDDTLPIIMTGHLTTLGASTSESVRDIYIGSLEAFPAQDFPPADYIALGHIHRAQTLKKTPHIRYSGSPIPLSFDELEQEKSVFLITLNGNHPPEVEALSIPRFQRMRLIRGNIDHVKRQLAQFSSSESDKNTWLDIEIESQSHLSDLQRQITQLTQTLPVDILLLRRSKTQRQRIIEQQAGETLAELTLSEVFERRLELEEDPEDKQVLRELFQEVVLEINAVQEGFSN